MECRIESKSEACRTVLTIAGRLSGQVIEEFRGVRRKFEHAVTLDLSSLVSADDEGMEAIRAMSRQGDEIRNASRFVELLLENDPLG